MNLYKITPETSGIVLCYRGRTLLIYPRSRFNDRCSAWEFVRRKWGGWLHLGAFGICWEKVYED